MITALIVGIFSGYYIYIVLGSIGLGFGLLFWGPKSINLLSTSAMDALQSYTLLAIPLFIFMGNMLDKSGVADKLFHSLNMFLGKLKGGLAVSALLISIIFAASTGV